MVNVGYLMQTTEKETALVGASLGEQAEGLKNVGKFFAQNMDSRGET
jgi:hypothetical protein